MDASNLYPLGFHPIVPSYLPDFSTPSSRLTRSTAKVRYYFIDYGISTHVPPGSPPVTVIGRAGRDQDVPELSETKPYDLFPIDVFIVGNVLRTIFYDADDA